MKEQFILFLANFKNYTSQLFLGMQKISSTTVQIIFICLGILLLVAIFIVIGQIIYKRRVRTFWSLQNKLLIRCR